MVICGHCGNTTFVPGDGTTVKCTACGVLVQETMPSEMTVNVGWIGNIRIPLGQMPPAFLVLENNKKTYRYMMVE